MSNGVNLRRGETSSYPPFVSTNSAVCAVRCFITTVSGMSVKAAGHHRKMGREM